MYTCRCLKLLREIRLGSLRLAFDEKLTYRRAMAYRIILTSDLMDHNIRLKLNKTHLII